MSLCLEGEIKDVYEITTLPGQQGKVTVPCSERAVLVPKRNGRDRARP